MKRSIGINKALLLLHNLENMYEMVAESNKELSREIRKLPKGSLQIQAIGNKYGIYTVEEGVRKSIPRNDKKAKALVRKTIAQCELKRMEKCEKILKKAMKSMKEICETEYAYRGKVTIDRIKKMYDDPTFYLSSSERNWLRGIKRSNDFYSDNLKYRTKTGHMVRSKSEMIIADLLYEYGILYVYEPKLVVNGRTVVPDFVIYRPDGKIIIWEHFGLMDDENYRRKAIEKIDNYGKIGYRQHTNLICTDEEDVRNPETIRTIIEERVLCYGS